MTQTTRPTINDIRAAAAVIADHVVRTPLVHSHTLSTMLGAEIHLKLESLQFTASFKERGALNKLTALTPEQRAAGVVAMSAGNHAQAVACHATRLGVPSTIVMPRFTPFVKVSNTEALGATVALEGENLSEAAAYADQLAKDKGLTRIHPYDDPLIIAGQGTVALEMLNDRPDLDTLSVPIGGGGLISGCAIAAKAIKPEIEVIGVEAELYPAMHQTLSGAPVHAEGFTIAEGIAVKDPGKLTQEIVRDLVDEIVLTSEAAIEQGVQMIAEIEKLVTEGAGAAALAAIIEHRERFAGKRVGVILSGANIDSRVLASVLMRGLVRSGRLVRLRVRVGDVPGSLSRVTGLIGELGGNIVEVDHERWYYDVPVRMTELDFLIETRGPDNADAIVQGLRKAGLKAQILSGAALD